LSQEQFGKRGSGLLRNNEDRKRDKKLHKEYKYMHGRRGNDLIDILGIEETRKGV
jgi:hypothetical protein